MSTDHGPNCACGRCPAGLSRYDVLDALIDDPGEYYTPAPLPPAPAEPSPPQVQVVYVTHSGPWGCLGAMLTLLAGAVLLWFCAPVLWFLLGVVVLGLSSVVSH